MYLKQLELDTRDASKIEALMNPSEENGLYFYHSWDREFSVSKPHNDSCLNVYSANESSYKIVQKNTATEIVSYDDFIPKNNIPHFLYSVKDGKLLGHFMINGDNIEKKRSNYELMFNTAKELTAEFETLILAEVYPKIKKNNHF